MHEKELIWMANEHRSAVYVYIYMLSCTRHDSADCVLALYMAITRSVHYALLFFFLVSHCCRHEQKQTPWCVIYCSFMCSIRVVGQPTYNEVPGVDRCANASGTHAVADASV